MYRHLCALQDCIVQLKGLPSAFCPVVEMVLFHLADVEFGLTSPGAGDGFSACGGFSSAGACSGCVCCFPSLPVEPWLCSCCSSSCSWLQRFLLSFLGYWQKGLQNSPTQDFEPNWRWVSVLPGGLLPSTATGSQYFRNSLPEPLSSHNVKLF